MFAGYHPFTLAEQASKHGSRLGLRMGASHLALPGLRSKAASEVMNVVSQMPGAICALRIIMPSPVRQAAGFVLGL